MKQKLALACTLIHEPRLIALDEPTTGVDPVSRREFWKLLSEFLSDGITIVMSTPYLDEAERCSRIALLHQGRILALDAPGRLQAALPGTLIEAVVPDPRGALDRLAAEGADRVQVFGDRLHAWREEADPGRALAAFDTLARRAGVLASRARVVAPSLEDVFIAKLSQLEETSAP